MSLRYNSCRENVHGNEFNFYFFFFFSYFFFLNLLFFFVGIFILNNYKKNGTFSHKVFELIYQTTCQELGMSFKIIEFAIEWYYSMSLRCNGCRENVHGNEFNFFPNLQVFDKKNFFFFLIKPAGISSLYS